MRPPRQTGWRPGLALEQRSSARGATFAQRRAVFKYDDYLLGDPAGQFVLLGLTALCLIAAGTCSWLLSGGSKGMANDTFSQALWMSYSLFIDTGTQTAVPSTERSSVKLISMCFSIFGFVFNLVLLGLIVEKVRWRLREWRLTRGKIVRNNHIVILGWTDRTLFLVSALCELVQGLSTTIVILGDVDEQLMRSELRLTFPEWRRHWPHIECICIQGRPFEVNDLAKVSVHSASIVVALACSRNLRNSDSQTATHAGVSTDGD